MIHVRRHALAASAAACAALLLAACAPMATQPPSAAPLSTEKIAAIVGAADRSAADLATDARRQPAQLLAFIGLRPGINALDVSAGGGYTTELLARAIGPGGTVYAQRPPRVPNAAAPSTSPVTDRAARLRSGGVPAATIVALVQPFDNPVPAAVANGQLELVTLMLNYHDLGHLGVDRAAMNRALFQALKPGGAYVISDHAGRAGTGISESNTLHRIEESFLRQEVERAGFRLAAQGTFLRNPNDPRDRNPPEPAQPKDEFLLKFVKP